MSKFMFSEIPVNGEAVLFVRSKENNLIQLKAEVTPNGMGKTVRINKPLPKIKTANNHESKKDIFSKKNKAKTLVNILLKRFTFFH